MPLHKESSQNEFEGGSGVWISHHPPSMMPLWKGYPKQVQRGQCVDITLPLSTMPPHKESSQNEFEGAACGFDTAPMDNATAGRIYPPMRGV